MIAEETNVKSIRSYLEAAKPIVKEVYRERQVINQFRDNLSSLQAEVSLFDDTLKIYLCWEDNISRQLHRQYSKHELLELHGVPGSDIIQEGSLFTISYPNGQELQFIYCKHNTYSVVQGERDFHQCLLC